MPRLRLPSLLACALLLSGHVARADDASEWQLARPSGNVTEQFQLYGRRIEGLPSVQERLDAQLEFGLGNGTYGLKAVPWVWLRAPDAVGGDFKSARPYGDLKEAWIERVSPFLDIRAGNQLFGWGTADQINPTDLLNTRDAYDVFQSPKLPILALDVKVHPPQLDRVSLELVATPFFRASRLPLDIPGSGVQSFSLLDSRWFLPFPTNVQTGDGAFAAPLQYQVTEATFPDTFQAGARLRVTSVGGWDFSVSYANWVESLPRIAFTTHGASSPSFPLTVTLHPSYHREQMFGVDGAGSVSIGDTDVGTRFEGAYFARDNSRAYEAPVEFQADLLRDDYIHFVLGADYTFKRRILGTVLYLNLQYVHYQRFGSLEQIPGRYILVGGPTVLPWDRNLVLFWEDRMGQNAQFKILGTMVVSLQNGDGLASPALQYGWTDNLKTTLGADFFVGNPSGFFGQFGQNSRFNFSGTYSF